MNKRDWTCDRYGRSNSSITFQRIVAEVDQLLRGHRLGTNTKDTARLIVAQLAHKHGLRTPAAQPEKE